MFARIQKAWSWLAAVVHTAMMHYLHAVDPRYVVTAYLVVNVGIALLAITVTTSWNDWYTVSGYWVTLTGFLVAISELYRARTTGEQIRAAVGRESKRQEQMRIREELERCRSCLHKAMPQVDQKQWKLANLHLTELMELFIKIKTYSMIQTDPLRELTQRLERLQFSFDSSKVGTKASVVDVWFAFTRSTLEFLHENLANIPSREEVDDDA
jgi:hypothetical protein